ncbi:tripartite tricarboxylate transporter substrate binding protein [Allofranklinella schreckenbergeri]|uniref:Tripartite tricarboxylate transporter substrate binding protein n=1 Tax=Allofranklinella schreckenbergeri TaxID=1076744 RepID=A0A3M6Q221_9BURK|nr:tripartite tricarboxylate transporter substrate binding protein [Allofranklinella schreckenbergeri]RMW97016.1 tripartite tricarboxylate transporter substrate binding protein [Allofranklinella schreckenbergeri]
MLDVCATEDEATPVLGRRALLLVGASACLCAAWPGALAQTAPAGQGRAAWPHKPLSLIVPFGAGGVADVTARTVARAMEADLGQPLVIDNRPGAGGITATSAAVRAQPDGHTLLLISNATAISATLFPKQPFDARRDLQAVSTLGHFDLAVCVRQDAPWQNLAQMLRFAKDQPGKLSIGTIAVGSTQNLTAQMLKAQAGVEALVVPYKSSPEVVTALRSGQIDVAVDILSPLLAHVTAGSIRALAVTAAARHPLLPDTPTAAEAGLADFLVSSWNGLAVPQRTPPAVVQRLNAAVHHALAQDEVQQQLTRLGVRPAASTAEGLAQLLESDTLRWRKVIEAAGIAPAA